MTRAARGVNGGKEGGTDGHDGESSSQNVWDALGGSGLEHGVADCVAGTLPSPPHDGTALPPRGVPDADWVRSRLGWYANLPASEAAAPPRPPCADTWPGAADGAGNSYGVFRDAALSRHALSRALANLHSRHWDDWRGGTAAETQAGTSTAGAGREAEDDEDAPEEEEEEGDGQAGEVEEEEAAATAVEGETE